MTTQLPSKVRLAQISSFSKSMALPPSHDEIEAMARALLAAYEQEPIGITDKSEIECLKNGEMINVMPLDYQGVDEGDEVYIYAHPAPSIHASVPDYFASLVAAARVRADKAMSKYPQPNYVLNKVAEESGEVIKAVIHYTEGREEWANVEGELIDNLAMLLRLVTEGDQVIGFTPPESCSAAMLQAEPAGWIPVRERLPAEGGRYWCYVEEQNSLGKSHYQWNCSWNGDVWSDDALTGRVTHWQPLPAPPKV